MSKDERPDIARVLDFVNAQTSPVSTGYVADALNIRYAYNPLGKLAQQKRIKRVGWGLYAPLTLDTREAPRAGSVAPTATPRNPPPSPMEDTFMAKKRTRPTLRDARMGPIPSVVDSLIDAHPGTAAARITRMERRELELVVMHIVRSVDPRWRFSKPLPLSPDDETESMRRRIAAILEANPHAIVPASLALGDAVKAWDPRPRLDIKDTPHTPDEDAA